MSQLDLRSAIRPTRHGPSSMATLSEAHRDLDAAARSSNSSSTASTTRRWRRRWQASGAGALPAVVRQAAQGQALPARRQARGTVPRKVGDRRFGLEPAVRRDAWRASSFEVDGETLNLEPTLQPPVRDTDETKREAAFRGAGARRFRREHPALHPHHQRAGQGQGNLRPLARLQGHRRQPPPRQLGGARGGRCPARRCAEAYPRCRTATTR